MSSPLHSVAESQPAADLIGSTIGRYRVRSLLGSGGQGEVYCAEDLRLNRTVALKRLSPLLRTDERYRQRFLREAQRASGLNDAHIASIYDVLEHQGELLLVMEYVEGVSLRQRLRDPLAPGDFLRVAIQACEALIAAHESGVVHRDIKPENIMLTRTGRVKVLDFGVAKRLPAEGESVGMESTETKAGEISGTPAYMAPELLLQRESDGRADIFSLGVVFYELLAGQHPFLVPGLVATVDRILHEKPRSIAEQNPAVPAALEQIVFTMLAKSPAERYASAQELLEALHSMSPASSSASKFRRLNARALMLIVAAVIVALLAAAAMRWFQPSNQSSQGSNALPQQRYVVVLPFRAIGGDPLSQAYAEGLTATLTAKLTQLTAAHEIQVAPAGEIHAHKIASLEQAHKELGANLVLEGSLHLSGGAMRVSYALVDPATKQQLQADTITADSSNPFLLEDRTVEGVLRMLQLDPGAAERQALSSYGTSVRGAYDFYLRGRGLLEKDNPEDVEAAIDLFNRALSFDSKYPPAYAGLGQAFWRKYELSRQPAWVNSARQACDRAVALDAKLAAAHLCLGTLANGTGKHEQAVKEFQRAVQIEPTSDDAYLGLGFAYERLNRQVDAEKTYQEAIRRRPYYWAGYRWLGNFYIGQARYKEAAEQFEKAISIVPDSSQAINRLGAVYIYLGRYQDAIPTFEKAIALRPTVQAYSNLGTSYLNLRQFDQAIPAFEQAVLLDSLNYIPVSNLARAYYWSGTQRHRAPAVYRRAIELAEQQLKVNPNDGDAHILLAQDLTMVGDRERAFHHLKRGLALRPDDPESLVIAAVVHNRFGQKKSALEWLERAVSRGYSQAEIRNAVELENLHSDKQFERLIRPR